MSTDTTQQYILGETIALKFYNDWATEQWRQKGFMLIAKLVSESNLEPQDKAAIAIALGCPTTRACEELNP